MEAYYKQKTKEEIEEILEESNSLSEVMKKLGYTANRGNSYKPMKDYFNFLGIDTSKFSKNAAKNFSHPKAELSDILVVNSNYTNMSRLKKRLIAANLIEYKCSICGNKGEWMGKEIVLQLDHINGNNRDNRIENLRFLCPNCHSQTDTFCRKGKKK